METCALTNYRGRRIETLSKGYKQRTGLAQAILHDPPILILDEPTTGLDPNQIIEIRSLIKELGKRKTVILSTHILQEVEAICSNVLIINDGRIAALGKPEEIALSMKGGDTWELKLLGADAETVKNKLCMSSQEIGQVSNLSVENNGSGFVSASFFVQAEEGSASSSGEAIFDWAVAHNIKIVSMNRKKLSIEDIFVKLTGDETKPHNSQGELK